jgi:hypothetical protein
MVKVAFAKVFVVSYAQEGYQHVDIWRAYYTDGEDALVMEKQLL